MDKLVEILQAERVPMDAVPLREWGVERGIRPAWVYRLVQLGRLAAIRVEGKRGLLVRLGAEVSPLKSRFQPVTEPVPGPWKQTPYNIEGVYTHDDSSWRWTHSTTPVARCDHVCRSCGSFIVTGTRYLRYLKASWGRSGGAVCWPCAILVAPLYSRPGWEREDSDGRKGWRGVWHKGGEIIGHGLRWPCRALDEALAAERAETEL